VPKVLEVAVAVLFGRLLIGLVSGESMQALHLEVVDWRWLLAVPAAALLVLMVEIVVNPDFLE
jgi:hypothetical protein